MNRWKAKFDIEDFKRFLDRFLSYDQETNLAAILELEGRLRAIKDKRKRKGLELIEKLLIAAMGHGHPLVREKAVESLHLLYQPIPVDAPPPSQVYIVPLGERIVIPLKDTKRVSKNIMIAIYYKGTGEKVKRRLVPFNREIGGFSVLLKRTGIYEFAALRRKAPKEIEWLEDGTSGRIIVHPPLKRKIFMEIWPDYFGLKYDEKGRLIRKGTFDDITDSLEHLYAIGVEGIYLLGIQERGENPSDRAGPDGSPFSPLEPHIINRSLGGEDAFIRLVNKAHKLGIKIVVDLIPHINRVNEWVRKKGLVVKVRRPNGEIVPRAATDGTSSEWFDSYLLNFRKKETWDYLIESSKKLVEKYDIDGFRIDVAHAIPLMFMPELSPPEPSPEEIFFGEIISDERDERGFLRPQGYWETQSKAYHPNPFFYRFIQELQGLKEELYFIGESYWGREPELSRSGIIPYDSGLYGILKEIFTKGATTHALYDYFDRYLKDFFPKGTYGLMYIGNHDEERPLVLFGKEGTIAVLATMVLLRGLLLFYNGELEGETYKVFLDNLSQVDWKSFEVARLPGMEEKYRYWLNLPRHYPVLYNGDQRLLPVDNDRLFSLVRSNKQEIIWGIINLSNEWQRGNVSIGYIGNLFKDSILEISALGDGNRTTIKSEDLRDKVNTSWIPPGGTVTICIKKAKERRDTPSLLIKSILEAKKISNLDLIREDNFLIKDIRDSLSDKKEFYEQFLYIIKNSSKDLLTLLNLNRLFFEAVKGSEELSTRILTYFIDLKDQDSLVGTICRNLLRLNRIKRIVFLTAEVSPFSKRGGLADVARDLPKEFRELGIRVSLISNYYTKEPLFQEQAKKYGIKYIGKNVVFFMRNEQIEAGVHHLEHNQVDYYFLHHPIYTDFLYGGEMPMRSDEQVRRAIFFARGAIELIRTFNLSPDAVFSNDWFTAFFTPFIKVDPFYRENSNFKNATYSHILHNAGIDYQGRFPWRSDGEDLFSLFNVSGEHYFGFQDPHYPQLMNPTAAAIRHSDAVFTVSPTYAKEITEDKGDGLEVLFKEKPPIGILNGLRKKDISKEIASLNMEKFEAKRALQEQCGLDMNSQSPLFTIVSRVTNQKGLHLIADMGERIIGETGAQIAILGAPTPGDGYSHDVCHRLWLLSQKFSGSFSAKFEFASPWLYYYGGDFFLMPSVYEPCGIAQMLALMCGTLVVAHKTGGLVDTVHEIVIDPPSGNGFLFEDYTHEAFFDAISRANQFYRERHDIFRILSSKAPETVVDWRDSALEYIKYLSRFRGLIFSKEIMEKYLTIERE